MFITALVTYRQRCIILGYPGFTEFREPLDNRTDERTALLSSRLTQPECVTVATVQRHCDRLRRTVASLSARRSGLARFEPPGLQYQLSFADFVIVSGRFLSDAFQLISTLVVSETRTHWSCVNSCITRLFIAFTPRQMLLGDGQRV